MSFIEDIHGTDHPVVGAGQCLPGEGSAVSEVFAQSGEPALDAEGDTAGERRRSVRETDGTTFSEEVPMKVHRSDGEIPTEQELLLHREQLLHLAARAVRIE